MNFEELDQLLHRDEDETLEYKVWLEAVPLAYSIASFANTAGGLICIGIREPRNARREILGCSEEQFKHTFDKAISLISPAVTVSTADSFKRDQLFVPIIRVEKSLEPVLVKGTAWIRQADQTRPMTVEELRTSFANSQSNALVVTNEDQVAQLVVQFTEFAEKNQLEMEKLRRSMEESGHWLAKIKDNFIGFLISTILGYLLGIFTH